MKASFMPAQDITYSYVSENKVSEVLIVDNSKWLISAVAMKIETELNLSVRSVQSYSDAARLVEDNHSGFLIALTGLYLRDAPDGAIVDLLLSNRIPTIVFTGRFDDKVREDILSKKVVDYVLKEDIHSLDHVVSLIRRIRRNKEIKVLVAEDSPFVRRRIRELLKAHQYQVFEACNGKQAVSILDENPDIKLVITDYYMPNMDGFELTKTIRSRFTKEELAIIGISGYDDERLSPCFIKNGANDFMLKPFLIEEFYCRVTQNIEMIEYIRDVRASSDKDYLTGLYNRRYLFESGVNFYTDSKKKFKRFSVGLIDIDDFKEVNDTYGHDVGDMVLRKVSVILQTHFRDRDIVLRFGGDEFCVLAVHKASEKPLNIFEELRKAAESARIDIGCREIGITLSIGLCAKLLGSLEMMIKQADIMLYEAKRGGRNRVVCFSETM